MAALRHAARRLGGSAMQRPQALYYMAARVSPQEQRLLPLPAIFRGGGARPRPMSTSSRSGAPEDATMHPRLLAQIQAESRLARIHEKKEELYDVLLKLQRLKEKRYNFFRRHIFISRDKELLVDLSELIRPKPDDISWCKEYRTFRSRLLRGCTSLLGGYLIYYLLWKYIQQLQDEASKQTSP